MFRFLATLSIARLETRCRTRSLRLSPAALRVRRDPMASWLREILDLLPKLKALEVAGLKSLDHEALMALKMMVKKEDLEKAKQGPPYELRLLRASAESNATALGLDIALTQAFPHLISLDLSYTKAARDVRVLNAIGTLRHLRVLKLRAVGLRQTDVVDMLADMGTRLRLLDVRSNYLTDLLVECLRMNCFLQRDAEGGSDAVDDSWLTGNHDALGQLQTEEFDEYITGAVTDASAVQRHAIEDLPSIGLTHLYVAQNFLTMTGVRQLLATGNMHVLDAGTTRKQKIAPQHDFGVVQMRRLTYLRVDYHLIAGGSEDFHPSSSTTLLSPSHIPNVRTLALTNIPATTADPSIITRLQNFIKACSTEETIALDLAKEDWSLPPPSSFRSRRSTSNPLTLHQRSKRFFALDRIILEVVVLLANRRTTDSYDGDKSWMASVVDHRPIRPERSAVEDEDTERFWEAAKNDFSFFADEKRGGSGSSTTTTTTTTARRHSSLGSSREKAEEAEEVLIDVVQELAAFRREKKAEFEKGRAEDGQGGRFVEGHWSGEVKVVRKSRK